VNRHISYKEGRYRVNTLRGIANDGRDMLRGTHKSFEGVEVFTPKGVKETKGIG
jgi:hypothetical protein